MKSSKYVIARLAYSDGRKPKFDLISEKNVKSGLERGLYSNVEEIKKIDMERLPSTLNLGSSDYSGPTLPKLILNLRGVVNKRKTTLDEFLEFLVELVEEEKAQE